MSDDRRTGISADKARRQTADRHAPRPPHLMPAQPGDAAERTVIRIPLGPSEWALMVQPDGRRLARPASACLSGPYIPPVPGQFALIRIPGPADPALGPAVLHYRRGHTMTYCPDTLITHRAAWVLSALAGQAIDTALAGQAIDHDPVRQPRLTVTPVGHDLLPAGLHPAAPLPDGRDITFFACSSLIQADLAGILSILWTAHTRYLLHLSRPSTAIQPGQPTPGQVQLPAGAR